MLSALSKNAIYRQENERGPCQTSLDMGEIFFSSLCTYVLVDYVLRLISVIYFFV